MRLRTRRPGPPVFRLPRFHRTLSGWLNLSVQAAFAIERLGEPMADELTASRDPTVADTRAAPLFLHGCVRKAGA